MGIATIFVEGHLEHFGRKKLYSQATMAPLTFSYISLFPFASNNSNLGIDGLLILLKDWNKDDVAELRLGAAGFEGDFAGRLTASVAAVIKEVSRIKSRLESFL